MCDEAKVKRWAKGHLSRREFGVVTGAAALSSCGPGEGASGGEGAATTAALELTESQIAFDTEAGTLDGLFVHPSEGKHPAVILWPDIAGIRESKRMMARRLAGEGYAVAVLNPYYRDVAGEQFADFAAFIAADGFQKVRPWRDKFSADSIKADCAAAAQWLGTQDAVDQERGIGVQGYCMTGSWAVTAPAAHEKIRAGASFHGGWLVTEADDSPHRLLRDDAHYLVAIAQDDDAQAPDDKTTLREAASAAGTSGKIEVYAGDHGWTVLDSPAYDEEAAELAYADLLALYEAAL